MKKILVIMIALGLSGSAFSQDGKKNPPTEQQERKDVLVMKGGTVMELNNDTWMPIDGQKTLKEGTRVSPNGTVTRKDGTIIVLKEGESIDWNGVWFPSKEAKPEKE